MRCEKNADDDFRSEKVGPKILGIVVFFSWPIFPPKGDPKWEYSFWCFPVERSSVSRVIETPESTDLLTLFICSLTKHGQEKMFARIGAMLFGRFVCARAPLFSHKKSRGDTPFCTAPFWRSARLKSRFEKWTGGREIQTENKTKNRCFSNELYHRLVRSNSFYSAARRKKKESAGSACCWYTTVTNLSAPRYSNLPFSCATRNPFGYIYLHSCLYTRLVVENRERGWNKGEHYFFDFLGPLERRDITDVHFEAPHDVVGMY